MSVSIDFAFNANCEDLSNLAAQVSDCLGTKFEIHPDADDFAASFLSLPLSLGDCDLVNDRNLVFENYRFLLSSTTSWGQSDRRSYQLEATSLAAYVLLSDVASDGMLVFDTQILLAEYENKSLKILDRESGTEIAFPEHFDLLRMRHEKCANK